MNQSREETREARDAVRFAVGPCSLGEILVAATDRGVERKRTLLAREQVTGASW